jgi:hypothetical protein
MKITIFKCVILWSSLAFVVTTGTEAATVKPGDHLVPISKSRQQSDYWNLWQRKLLVTRGDIARFVLLPGAAGLEGTISIYQDHGRNNGLPGGYWVTGTQPSVNLAECIAAPNLKPLIDPKTVKIKRWDAPLRASTALAIRKAWLAMFSRIGPEPNPDVLLLDSSTEIISAQAPDGRILIGQAPKRLGETTRALIRLGNTLMDFVSGPVGDRPKLEQQIERDAKALLKRVAQ